MGVIQRFAVSSMVLGVLAMAGGASALAFESGGSTAPSSPAPEQTVTSDLASDVPSDAPEMLPDTGGPDAAVGWFAPSGR